MYYNLPSEIVHSLFVFDRLNTKNDGVFMLDRGLSVFAIVPASGPVGHAYSPGNVVDVVDVENRCRSMDFLSRSELAFNYYRPDDAR